MKAYIEMENRYITFWEKSKELATVQILLLSTRHIIVMMLNQSLFVNRYKEELRFYEQRERLEQQRYIQILSFYLLHGLDLNIFFSLHFPWYRVLKSRVVQPVKLSTNPNSSSPNHGGNNPKESSALATFFGSIGPKPGLPPRYTYFHLLNQIENNILSRKRTNSLIHMIFFS